MNNVTTYPSLLFVYMQYISTTQTTLHTFIITINLLVIFFFDFLLSIDIAATSLSQSIRKDQQGEGEGEENVWKGEGGCCRGG